MELRLARREFTCCPEFSTPFLVACIATAGVTLVARDRNEKEMLSQLERSQAELRMLRGQIDEHQRRGPHLDERLHQCVRAD